VFRDLSIRRKLNLLIGGTAAGAVLLVGLLVGAFVWMNERHEVALTTRAQADLTARGTGAALLFDDPAAAQDTLRAFSFYSDIVTARLYDRDGRLFAEYLREDTEVPPDAPPDTLDPPMPEGRQSVGAGHALAVEPVRVRGERVGTVAIVSDLSRAYEEVDVLTRAVLAVVAAALLLSTIVSARLQRIISTPVVELADVMDRVTRKRDYAARARVEGGDELAVLARGFNDMLAQIQARDQALERHGAELAAQVAERTRELAASNRQLTTELRQRRRTEALVRAQNSALETLARGEPLPRTLGVIARFLEAHVPGSRCAILGREAGGGRARHLYAARLPPTYVEALEAWPAGPNGFPCPMTADNRERVVADDIATHPLWATTGRLALLHGLAACWCMPVAQPDGDLMGRICLYHDHPVRPTPAQMALLESSAALVAMALEREAAAARMTQMAHYDGLTGLPNRRMFTDRLTQALGRARRRETRVAVLFVDLDRFKPVNDILGHAVGDEVLRELAGRLRVALREEDTLARIGGDEFTVILEEVTRREDAVRVAERLLAAVTPPLEVAGQEVVVGASVGIALSHDDGDDAATLVKNADMAMYRAKQDGRGVFCFYAGEMADEASARLRMEAALRHALEREEFRVYLQPQVEAAGGRLVGAEALLRWVNDDVGPVGPDVFVPILEETGLIFPVGEWVLAEACRIARAWPEVHGAPLRIAVNLSGRQLHQADPAALVARVLEETGLPASRLELELTESVVMEHAGETVERLKALDALGVSLAVDDFGTGYSSLSYLKAFPIRALKIDRSFVHDITDDDGDRAIAAAVISLAHSLNLHVVAEGVETTDQLAVLRDLNCDLAQGYLFGRPEPAEDFAARLNALGPAPVRPR
jgi:diguanylate cyclase (GGDEF)-like protein